MDSIWLLVAVFLASLCGVLAMKRRARDRDEVGAQFVVTGTLLIIFYLVCFCSGVCSILNFLFRWVF